MTAKSRLEEEDEMKVVKGEIQEAKVYIQRLETRIDDTKDPQEKQDLGVRLTAKMKELVALREEKNILLLREAKEERLTAPQEEESLLPRRGGGNKVYRF